MNRSFLRTMQQGMTLSVESGMYKVPKSRRSKYLRTYFVPSMFRVPDGQKPCPHVIVILVGVVGDRR